MLRIFCLFTLALLGSSCQTRTPINGELFIVTKGAGNYKLGAVSVSAFLKRDVELEMISFKRGLLLAISEATRERESCSSRVSSASNPYGWEAELTSCFDKEQAKFVQEFSKLFNPSLLAKATAVTNSDGKFTLELPSKGEYVLVAKATRMTGRSEENYFFYHPVNSDGIAKTEIISNGDLLDPGDIESLFK